MNKGTRREVNKDNSKYRISPITRPPQIALSTRLSTRHIVPKFENKLKTAGTFRKRTLKAVIWRHKINLWKPANHNHITRLLNEYFKNKPNSF